MNILVMNLSNLTYLITLNAFWLLLLLLLLLLILAMFMHAVV